LSVLRWGVTRLALVVREWATPHAVCVEQQTPNQEVWRHESIED